MEGESEGQEIALGLLFPVTVYLISHCRGRGGGTSQLRASSRLTSYFPSGGDSLAAARACNANEVKLKRAQLLSSRFTQRCSYYRNS